MSTQPISSSGLSSTSSVTSQGGGTPLQITGLASGLDTNAIIQQLMAIDRLPVVNLQRQQSGLQALNSQLTTIQSALQTLAINAQALGDPSLFAPSQTVTSSNPTMVSATTTGSVGAVVGGYEVAVSALATPAQRTFTFTSPAAADTVTVDGQQISLAAGASSQDLVNAINSNSNVDVWATATNANTVVFSDRATGNQTGSYIQVSDTASALTEQTALANAGTNAQYSINGGTTATSSSNTVTGAIPGVTLTLNALTPTGSPVTINVGAPAPSTSNIQAAVTTFVNSYNTMIDQINAQLNQKPVSGDPTQGALFGDEELSNLLGDMRQTMYTPGAGLPTGMASLADIGITTGSASGSSTFSQDSVDGKLTVNATALANAIQSNPSGVESVLQSWSQSFSQVVNAEAAPGGSLDARIQGDSSEISDLGNRIDDLNAALTDRQQALTAQFASLEAALSQSQSEGQWLASQIASLP